MQEVFQELPISKLHSDQLKETAASLFSKFPDSIDTEISSGVVIAGFGEKDIFPSIKAYEIEGIVNNKLKYRESLSDEINQKTEHQLYLLLRERWWILLCKVSIHHIDILKKVI